jgi:hypothetical protein
LKGLGKFVALVASCIGSESKAHCHGGELSTTRSSRGRSYSMLYEWIEILEIRLNIEAEERRKELIDTIVVQETDNKLLIEIISMLDGK